MSEIVKVEAPATVPDTAPVTTHEGERVTAGPNQEAALRRITKERDDAREEARLLKEATKTQEQKAIDDAYNRGKTETQAQYETRMKAERIDATIRRTLIENGVPEDQVFVITGKNPDGFDDADIAKKAAADYAASWKEANKPGLSGHPGAPDSRKPSDPNRPWSNQKVNAYARANGTRIPPALRAEMAEDQKNKTFIYD